MTRGLGVPLPPAPGWAGWAEWMASMVVVSMVVFGDGCTRRADAETAPGAPLRGASAAATPRIGDGGTIAPPAGSTGLQTLDTVAMRREMRKALGRMLFVHLWASWCGPCLEELPLIDRFARVVRARGGVVLSVALDNDYRGIARIPAVLRARAPGLTSSVAYFDDPEQFMALFSKSWQGSIPALFVFDPAGKPARSLIGEVEPADIDALIADFLPLPPARGSAR